MQTYIFLINLYLDLETEFRNFWESITEKCQRWYLHCVKYISYISYSYHIFTFTYSYYNLNIYTFYILDWNLNKIN